ncbi:MAG: hypothetical protein KKD21_12045 [Proteobacteria bacterium]|nr:hypothetical protein [Pseudomonadota bacterium]MBU1697754.1 hypothetical protein [Pseudomonadota bacterium]
MNPYQQAVTDEEFHTNDGQILGGVAIGIILFGQAGYSFPPGSVENALTFKYPVLFHGIHAASVDSVVSPKLDQDVISQLVEAGLYLEQQGCRAIIGACGYFANYLPEVVEKLHTPCFFSSLMQVPMILSSLRPKQKIGVLCANGKVLKSAPVLANCGIHDPSRLVIAGAEELPEMKKILTGVGHYNTYKLEQGLINLAKGLVKQDPDIGALLLECTLFPSHAWAIQKELKLPVFDFSTLIDWVHSAVVRKQFFGYM